MTRAPRMLVAAIERRILTPDIQVILSKVRCRYYDGCVVLRVLDKRYIDPAFAELVQGAHGARPAGSCSRLDPGHGFRTPPADKLPPRYPPSIGRLPAPAPARGAGHVAPNLPAPPQLQLPSSLQPGQAAQVRNAPVSRPPSWARFAIKRPFFKSGGFECADPAWRRCPSGHRCCRCSDAHCFGRAGSRDRRFSTRGRFPVAGRQGAANAGRDLLFL
jgi:hypothetical protein